MAVIKKAPYKSTRRNNNHIVNNIIKLLEKSQTIINITYNLLLKLLYIKGILKYFPAI